MRLSNFIVIAAAITLTSCEKKESAVAKEPALIVNGDTITAHEFAILLTKKLRNFDALAAKEPSNIKHAKEMVLQEIIVSSLLRQEAVKKNISISDEDVNLEFDHIRKNYPDDLTFRAALAAQNQSLGEWKESLKQTLLEKKVFETLSPVEEKVSRDLEDQARRYYADHKSEFFRPIQVHIQQIVVAKEDDADRLLKRINKGTNFAELAKKFSISPDAKKGGDIGYISKGIVPAFDVAFNLKVGQTSGVIKSGYGFHIMRVLDRKPATALSFEVAKERIIRGLLADKQQLKFKEWLEAATKASKIVRNDSIIDRVKIHTGEK